MYIEKNVFDSLIGILLGIDDKGKDGLKARQNLVDLNIQSSLHSKALDLKKTLLPPARFTLSKKEKKNICQVFKDVKVPDGYAANISRHVDPVHGKIWGLKSHDCHVAMQ